MNSQTDQELLRDYVESRSEAAFSELVRRHVDLVYSAALRMTCNAHLAEDVTQHVFAALSRQAAELGDRQVLCGWLHRTARNIAANTVRAEVRRRQREQEAAAMNDLLSSESSDTWENVSPHLDFALESLGDTDRDAVLLRYFQHKSAREIANTLGITEDAAQKRVSRALERLRALLSERGIAAGASSLAALLASNAAHSAPIGFAAAVSTAALGTALIHTSATVAASNWIAMTTLQKTVIGAALTAAVGTGIYQGYEASQLRRSLEALQREHGKVVRQLESERDEHVSRIQVLSSENDLLKTDTADVLKLRGEVARLRTKDQQLATRQTRDGQPPVNSPEVAQKEFPRASWKDAGFATPQAALQTRGWAVINGDREKFKESLLVTDGARKTLLGLFEKMAAADPNGTFRQQAAQNNLGVEDGFLMPMMSEDKQKGYAGYRVLAQESPSADETILKIETQMVSAPPKSEVLKLRRVGETWKFVVDEDFLQAMGVPAK